MSGLNQVYQSVARLIKLCDDLLILGEKALNREYVTETVHLVEDAVQVCDRYDVAWRGVASFEFA